nr:GNAT family N-acetyltransferase [Planosporangium flavigriseum]
MELTPREYRESDAPALSELINAIENAGGAHAGLTPDFIGARVRSIVRDPASDSRLLFTPDGVLVAAGLLATPPDGGFRLDVMGGVHPGWRGRGIGRGLLGWELNRAAEIHRASAPDASWEVHLVAPGEDQTAVILYRRFGLTPVRCWFNMAASTATVPVVALPEGLRSTPYRSAYEKDLYEAHVEAFADHWGSQRRSFEEWATMVPHSENFLPGLSSIAFAGDEIAGYVLGYKDADPTRLYVGHVGVRRPWRRRGLAGALLSQVLRAARAAGMDTAALEADADSPTGAVGVYGRVGFAVETRAVTYARTLVP